MLSFVGIGVWSAKDISVRGLEELRACELAFAETYTSKLEEQALRELELLAGKEITVLSREEVEDGSLILEQAAEKNVVLLTSGDPMISTTHVSLQLAAEKQGIKTRIIHSSSILTATIGETGLHAYKFGNPVTLAFWSDRYKPTSTYDVIHENKKRGLHTLVFLDIRERCMTAKEALALLQEMEKKKKKKITRPSDSLIVAGRVGSREQKIAFSKIKTLEQAPLGEPPFILIVPGKLHFTEEEALERFRLRRF